MIDRLPPRERQIAHIVHAKGEASADEVRRALPDSLSSGAVRSMLQRIEAKGLLSRRRQGKKYLYRLAVPDRIARETALRRMSGDYFGGSLIRAARLLADMIAKEAATRRTGAPTAPRARSPLRGAARFREPGFAEPASHEPGRAAPRSHQAAEPAGDQR